MVLFPFEQMLLVEQGKHFAEMNSWTLEEMTPDFVANSSGEQWGDCVSHLSNRMARCARKRPPIRECLNASRLARGHLSRFNWVDVPLPAPLI
jgi:hypothetical protein